MIQFDNKVLSLILATSVLFFAGCNSLKKMIKLAEEQELTVTPSPLEVHADQVEFEMTARLPLKMLKKDKVYTINTYYEYGEEKVDLDPIEFKYEDFPAAAEQEPVQSATLAFDYEEGMSPGQLMVTGVASDPETGDEMESVPFPVPGGEGLILTSKLVQNGYFAAYAFHGYDNSEELIPVTFDFYFRQGRSNLRRSETRSERGEAYEGFIADKNVTRTVTITGTHSPEGMTRVNSDLSEDRAGVVENFYQRNMEKYDYKGVADSIEFILKPEVEKWSIFLDSLQNYDGISEGEKQEYADIINGSGTYEEKEDELHQLPTYDRVFEELYPKLRLADTEVLVVKEKKTDAQIAVLSKQIAEGSVNPDTLSLEELMYGASLTPSLDEKEKIYTAASKKEATWEVHNNLGAVYLEQAMRSGNMDDMMSMAEQAMTQFELSLKKGDNAEAHNNMAVVLLMQGNNEKALNEAMRASEMTPSIRENTAGINGVKGMAQIKMAEYEPAILTLSNANETSDNLFNRGLAQLLNDDYDNAMTSFDQALEEDSQMAIAYYGMAIAAARNGEDAKVFENLSEAVAMDSDLKEKAINDLEFTNYATNPEFQDAVK